MSNYNQDSFLFKYCLSVTAGCVAETASYPFDLITTRLQIQGENASQSGATQYRGMFATLSGVVKEEGVRKLWSGLSPSLYKQVLFSGCRMTFYEILREKVFKKNADGSFPVWKASICALFAGAIGQFVASPTDLVKVRMQMEGKRRLEGQPPRIQSTGQAFSQIVQEAGVKGLWKGWVPNVQRAALISLGDLAVYDETKHYILKTTTLKDNYVTHTLSSVCSGLAAVLMGTPADVVKARIMNQPTQDGKGLLYSGSVDCLARTVTKEGFLALYKGFLPNWARMVSWSMIFWLSLEYIRRITGCSSF